jgi:AraC-like DNA-binding protein
MLDSALRRRDFGNAPQRMAALIGLPELAAEFGVDLTTILNDFPLTPATFENIENRIPYALACQLMEKAAKLTGCPHLGLLLGARFDHRSMGILGRWMQNAPTLESALTGFIGLQASSTRGATAYLHRFGDDFIFGYGPYDRAALGYVQNYATVIPVAFNTINALAGRQAVFLEVLFSFRRPANPKPYEEFFGVPVRFDQPQTGLVISKSSLALPVVGADASIFAELQKLAATMVPPCDTPWSDRVRRQLRRSLLRGETRCPDAAAELGIHPKSLSRKLEAEGTTFQAILAEVRFGAAQELLAVTDLSAGEIALALGYANQPAFSHAFHRWCGMPPQQWRKEWMSGQATRA